MTISPKLKNFLIISAKNAVNALLVNGGLYLHNPTQHTILTWEGWKGNLWGAFVCIAAREITYWGPKLLAWSQTNGGTLMKIFTMIAALLAVSFTVGAQTVTTPPAAPTGSYSISVSGGYTLTSGNSTNNGFWGSVAIPVYSKPKSTIQLALRGDYFSISNPSTYVVTGGPEFRFQVSKATLFGGTPFQPFLNVGAGVARSQCVSTMSCPVGADTSSHAAFKVGGGLDMVANPTMIVRLIEVDYIRSTIFPTGQQIISNLPAISSGLSIRF